MPIVLLTNQKDYWPDVTPVMLSLCRFASQNEAAETKHPGSAFNIAIPLKT
jgi:hypothetical protein